MIEPNSDAGTSQSVSPQRFSLWKPFSPLSTVGLRMCNLRSLSGTCALLMIAYMATKQLEPKAEPDLKPRPAIDFLNSSGLLDLFLGAISELFALAVGVTIGYAVYLVQKRFPRLRGPLGNVLARIFGSGG